MCLTYGQRRALRKLKSAIRVSHRRLAARLDMLGWLNRDEGMLAAGATLLGLSMNSRRPRRHNQK